MRAGVQWRGRWSSEHKDVELIARVSLNVSHWLFQPRQPNRGGLVHAFAMKPVAGCAACGSSEKPFPHEWDSWGYHHCYPLRASCAVSWRWESKTVELKRKKNTSFQFLIFKTQNKKFTGSFFWCCRCILEKVNIQFSGCAWNTENIWSKLQFKCFNQTS